MVVIFTRKIAPVVVIFTKIFTAVMVKIRPSR
jgi:hypothetical protein